MAIVVVCTCKSDTYLALLRFC